MINLTSYEEVLRRSIPTANKISNSNNLKLQIEHQIHEISKQINRLKGGTTRTRRAINWIGSAWKWVAGNPDASDWDAILKSQDEIILNNNEQIKINTKLMDTTNKILEQYNTINRHFDEHVNDNYGQMLFNRLSILEGEIAEITLAEQLAKKGIVNTNLLDREEISQLIANIETLPYENEIEALEYAEPTVLVKGMVMLYVLLLPKTSEEIYNHVIIRSTTKHDKQVYLGFKEVFVNQAAQYGIKEKCNVIRNTTVCSTNQLEALPDEHCITRLIKGQKAECEYQFNKKELMEVIDDNTIFLDNFNGSIIENNSTKYLRGSFIVQINNESIKIRNQEFTNKEVRTLQILPTIFQTTPIERGVKIDVDYLHDLHLKNIKHLRSLSTNHRISLFTDISLISTLLIIFSILAGLKLKKRTAKLRIVHASRITTEPITCPQDLHPVRLNPQDLQPVRLNF